jgi:hypothetical protein
MDLHKPNNKLISAWLKYFWCRDNSWTYIDSQDSPWPKLEEVTTFPLILFAMISYRGYIQMSFCLGSSKLGVSKFPKLKFSTFWKTIISCVDFWLRWNLKQSYNPHRELSNNMWHVTCTHVFQGDYRLLMGGNQISIQIDTLTPDLSFGHNLWFKYSKESCEPILDIYVSKAFQWYK